MKVLIVEPGYSPYEADLENTPAALTAILESEQYTAAFPFDNTVIAAVYGGDAEKPYNRTLGSIGLVQGRFIVCGSRRGRFVGLTREQAQRYSRRLHFPEKFEERDGRLYSLPCCEGTRNIEVGTRNIKLTTLDKGRQRLILARWKHDK